MAAHMQNPGLPPRVSRDCFAGPSHPSLTATAQRVQMLGSRFALSPWLAQDLSWLCFGESCDE